MKMYEVEVSVTTDGDVMISQGCLDRDQKYILISREQAALVCQWIMAAAKSGTKIKDE